MAATVERKGAGALEPHGMPEHDVVTPDKRVGLHEMPDITKEAPEVEYEQPKRSWLRYLAVGVTVGAVAIGAGLVISSVVTETAPEYTSAYSLAREHLAQTPGGFPVQ